MRVSRLFVSMELSSGDLLTLDNESSHYVRTVLRLKKNDALCLFNGSGVEYSADVYLVTRKLVQVQLGQAAERRVESPLTLVFGIGIARGDRMDWAIQKAVELGVYSITPLLTARTVVQVKDDKKQQRTEHWQKIMIHAAEQCQRTMVPELTEIVALEHWVQRQTGLKLFLDPYAQLSLNDVQPIDNKVSLLSGPEGGFTQNERDLAKAAGFIPIRLGPRVLRSETAALAAISAVQMLWGDFAVFEG